MAETNDLALEAKPFPGVPSGALLRLSGKGGHGVVGKLQETIQPLLAEGTKNILFDCERLEFFNSAAFGYLINLSDSVHKVGGSVGFCRVPKKVQVAFDYLGLQEFFAFFPDETQAARSFRKDAQPRVESIPKSQGQAGRAGSGKAIESPPSGVKFALPTWLDEVDKPGPPPLDHLRWSALLQTVARRVGPEALSEICRRANAPAEGQPSQIARGILRGLRSPQELLGLFDEETLQSICRLYGLPEGGGKASLTADLLSFVEASTTESLARFMVEAPEEMAPVNPKETVRQVTNESLLQAIESCPFPKLPKSEDSARALLSKHLTKTFGRDKITANRPVGRHLRLKVDLDAAERFGILVRLGRSVLGKKASDLRSLELLLGQVVLLAGAYGRGNLFVVLLGGISKIQASTLGELRAWMESVGGRSIQR